jgi:hypothetical protein
MLKLGMAAEPETNLCHSLMLQCLELCLDGNCFAGSLEQGIGL